MDEWISVSDRLPDDNERKLVLTKCGSCFVGRYRHDFKRWAIPGTSEVTHWMPTPQPPKEVETDGT